MTEQHHSFPSIEQYRTIIKYVNDRCERHNRAPRPILQFHGTVKLHGMNASIVCGDDGSFYAQSRTQVITPEADINGFAAFAHSESVSWALLAFAAMAEHKYFSARTDYVERYPVNVAVYGEWCGGNIQGGVALSKLPKMFVIFAVRLISRAEPDKSVWLMPWDVEAAFDAVAKPDLEDPAVTWPASVKCIEKFKTWQLSINFGDPAAAQNELVRITSEVEAQCPVSLALGSDGVGEGVVWTCVGASVETAIRLDDLVFKVKGAKHSDSKVKTVAPVDIERLGSLKELAATFVTDHRLEKGVAYLKDALHANDVYDVKHLGEFLKWVGNDVLKEETDTIEGNGFEPREVTKEVNNLAKAWFFKKVNETLNAIVTV